MRAKLRFAMMYHVQYIGLIRSTPTGITGSGRPPASMSHCDGCKCLLLSLTKSIDLRQYSWSHVEYVYYTAVQVESDIRTTMTHYWVLKKWWSPMILGPQQLKKWWGLDPTPPPGKLRLWNLAGLLTRDLRHGLESRVTFSDLWLDSGLNPLDLTRDSALWLTRASHGRVTPVTLTGSQQEIHLQQF